MTAMHRTKWFLPLFSVALGIVFGAALWAGGEGSVGVQALGIMVVVGLVLLLGGRSDMIRGLRGDGRDEYWERIDVHATALAGIEYQAMTAVALVLTLALAGLFLAEGIRGDTGLVYGVLLIAAETTHVAALAVFNRRS